MDLLHNLGVVAQIRLAWDESKAGDVYTRHEEGGYILLHADSSVSVERWPRGVQARISPPLPDSDGRYNGKEIIATFHTHPNPPIDESGREWE